MLLRQRRAGRADGGAEHDSDKRLIAADIAGVRVINVYVPNGKGVRLPSFLDKLRWFERLRFLLDTRHSPEQELLLCGDFNVAREARDVYDPVRVGFVTSGPVTDDTITTRPHPRSTIPGRTALVTL